MDRSEIIQAARKFINTPYKHQGRTPEKELDCIGLIIATGWACGALPKDLDYKNYSRHPSGILQKKLDEHCEKLALKQVGAIALFNLDQTPHHCGIITQFNNDWGLIHAYENVRRVREHALNYWWESKIVGFYGFPGVDYDS